MNMLNYRIGCMLLGGILLLAGCGENTPVSQVPTQLSVLEEPIDPTPQPEESDTVDPMPDTYLNMVQDMGTEDAVFEYLRNHSESEDKEMTAKYGIGYVVIDPESADANEPFDPSAPVDPTLEEPVDPSNPDASSTGVGSITTQALTDCSKFFSGRDVNSFFSYKKNYIYTDYSGRPRVSSQQFDVFSPTAAPRQPNCQRLVGSWGYLKANVRGQYDGGHLVGSALGGFGGRVNMVPQERNFNRGVWAQMERAMRSCRWGFPPPCCNGALFGKLSVRPEYANPTDVTPIKINWFVSVTPGFGPTQVWSENFYNLAGGGFSGPRHLVEFKNFLRKFGCRV
jgi:DNA/RNA non-specific endonuclease